MNPIKVQTRFLWLSLALAGLATLPASADVIVFTGPAALYTTGGHYTVDTTNLIISDTASGFKLTGTLVLSWDRGGPALPTAAYSYLMVRRTFDGSAGTVVTPSSQMTGTLSTAGDHYAYGLENDSFVGGTSGPCAAVALLGGTSGVPLADGPFSASQTGNVLTPEPSCQLAGSSSYYLEQHFGLSAFSTGNGAFTLDFGSSLVSEVATEVVPEPSTFALVAAIALAAALRMRARRSRYPAAASGSLR